MRRNARVLVVGAGVLAAILLAACSSTPKHHSTTSSSRATTTTSTTSTTTTAKAPGTTTTTKPGGLTTTTTTGNPFATTTTTAVAPTTSTTTGPAFLKKAGAGSSTVAVSPTGNAQWKLSWHFSCTNTKTKKQTKGSFAMTLKPKKGGKSTAVTSQHGLGGGGTQFFPAAQYTLVITTTCNWTVTGAPV
jgi:hypothetical protein